MRSQHGSGQIWVEGAIRRGSDRRLRPLSFNIGNTYRLPMCEAARLNESFRSADYKATSFRALRGADPLHWSAPDRSSFP